MLASASARPPSGPPARPPAVLAGQPPARSPMPPPCHRFNRHPLGQGGMAMGVV